MSDSAFYPLEAGQESDEDSKPLFGDSYQRNAVRRLSKLVMPKRPGACMFVWLFLKAFITAFIFALFRSLIVKYFTEADVSGIPLNAAMLFCLGSLVILALMLHEALKKYNAASQIPLSLATSIEQYEEQIGYVLSLQPHESHTLREKLVIVLCETIESITLPDSVCQDVIYKLEDLEDVQQNVVKFHDNPIVDKLLEIFTSIRGQVLRLGQFQETSSLGLAHFVVVLLVLTNIAVLLAMENTVDPVEYVLQPCVVFILSLLLFVFRELESPFSYENTCCINSSQISLRALFAVQSRFLRRYRTRQDTQKQRLEQDLRTIVQHNEALDSLHAAQQQQAAPPVVQQEGYQGDYQAYQPLGMSTGGPDMAMVDSAADGRGRKGGKDKVPLPDGWKRAKDKSTGKYYFFNKATRKTQWTRPSQDDM